MRDVLPQQWLLDHCETTHLACEHPFVASLLPGGIAGSFSVFSVVESV